LNTKERHQAITHLKQKNHSISMLRKLFEASSSGYFSSLKKKISPRKIRREKLIKKIKTIFTQHKNRYGRPRIFRQLRNEGETISEKMVGLLMHSESLVAKQKRRFRPRTTQNISRPKYAPSLLKDRAAPLAPNEVIVTDI
jgi:putative transposase